MTNSTSHDIKNAYERLIETLLLSQNSELAKLIIEEIEGKGIEVAKMKAMVNSHAS